VTRVAVASDFRLVADVPPDLGAFLDATLHPGAPVRVVEDLPLLFRDDPRAFRRVLLDDADRAVAHVGGYMHDVVVRPQRGVGTPQKRRVAVLAAVAVHPRHRRKGLATRTLSAALDEAALRGAHAAALWSEADALYVAAGFERRGTEVVLVADLDRFAPPTFGEVRPFRTGDLDAVVALHDAEPARTLRDRATWEILLAVPRTSTYVLERGGRVLAYGVVGRGADLDRTLHEWGGEERLLPDLCGGVLVLRGDDELYVLAPPWKRRARDLFTARGAAVSEGPLCMLKALPATRDADPAEGLWLTGLDSM
jgi:GNAT superfamily N-acetyltransferase